MKRLKLLIIILSVLLLCTACAGGGENGVFAEPLAERATYKNPVLSTSNPDAWQGNGLSDPFVMRYNGVYYMYVTTQGGYIGLKCFSSTDLVNWKYEGNCCDEPETEGGFAPELVYHNGKFYMYTAPAGEGHYVFESDSPTGPFKRISKNIGLGFDAHVFIDHDGKWYFYAIGSNDLKVYPMSSPMDVGDGKPMFLSMNKKWTEGPMVVYHDGYYYLTYTGNDFMSASYRINYAVSTGDLTDFKAAENNPLLVSTNYDVCGVGHSSTVKGPDLDSHYIIYHNLVSDKGKRFANLDRVVFEDGRMYVLGPSLFAEVPQMADTYVPAGSSADENWSLTGSFENGNLSAGGRLISKLAASGNYTAEYNLESLKNGTASMLFSYTDENNYGEIVISADKTVKIVTVVDGTRTENEVSLNLSFGQTLNLDAVHSFQVEKKAGTYTIYYCDRLISTFESALSGGSIGYATSDGAKFGYIGMTEAVGGSSIKDESHPLSYRDGLILARDYALGSFEEGKDELGSFVSVNAGEVLNYYICPEKTGAYTAATLFKGAGNVEIYIDGELKKTLKLSSETPATDIARDIEMEKGAGKVLSVKVRSGSVDFYSFELLQTEAADEILEDYSARDGRPTYVSGLWGKTPRGTYGQTGDGDWGKVLYGKQTWGDYAIEADITPRGNVSCGLLVRTNNPGSPATVFTAGSNGAAAVGTDWQQGYYVGLSRTGVTLAKHNYNYERLASGEGEFATSKTYHLRVECVGANIKVYVDGALCIDYTDPVPFVNGMAGFKVNGGTADFDNLKIVPIR